MNEVACKVLVIFFEPLQRKGVPLSSVLEGTSLTLPHVRSRKARLDWSDFAIVMRNIRPHFTDDEYKDIGRTYLSAPGLRFASVVARLMLSPLEFYRWMNKPREGVGNQMFTCVVPSHRELPGNRIEMDLTLPDGYEVCWDFFVITSGSMEELPRLLGYPRAEVQLSRLPRGGRYLIKVPEGASILTRIRRFFTWPFTVRAAAHELRAAHESLTERFYELEAARQSGERQEQMLRTAHALNDLMLRNQALGARVDTVAQALVEVARFAGAEIRVTASKPELQRSSRFGVTDHPKTLQIPLEPSSGEVIGELKVTPQTDSDPKDSEELLSLIVPVIATGLQNSLFNANLEALVEERTVQLRAARDELAGTVEQLREVQASRERFFGNISHEIRTPLTLITLATADITARAGAALDERARASLSAVSDSARKLLRLVEELLLLAAGQEGKLRIHQEPSDLVALVRQLAAAWRPAAEEAKLAFEVRVPTGLSANIDPVAIERVASNLVSNAVKYTPSGGRVDIELVEEPAGIRLSIFDTGPGITDDLGDRLFGRFERSTGPARRKTGAGLGLSLAKDLVEAHGGALAAHRRPTGGSELRVTLPPSLVIRETARASVPQLQLLDVAAAAAIPSTSAVDRFAPAQGARGTIVLAEDDVQLAQLIARTLGDEYIVYVANDGLSALDLVQRQQPQLLITDVEMPGIDGIELARRFRERTEDKLAPVIILSAVLDLRTRVAGLEAGAVDYVTKPFEPTELRARVRAQFRTRDLALQLHRAHQLSSIGVLTSGLAHELRNPANGIVNAVEPLLEILPPDLMKSKPGIRDLLGVMKDCAQQIGYLSRQLLDFNKEGYKLDVADVPFADLLIRAITLAERALTGVNVEKEFEPGFKVRCAGRMMTQVLTNLVENAGHAAGYGGWVRVRAYESRGRCLIEVFDSGAGVPVALREQVFEPFFTTKAPGVGTGLGLSLSRDIVNRHGGRLEIRDQPPPTRFVIDLPTHSVHSEADDPDNALC